MTTLTSDIVIKALDRLFLEAENIDFDSIAEMAELSDSEQKRLMKSKTEYLTFYSRLKNVALPVSRETGQLLYMLVRGAKAKSVVEFGTSFGISTIHLASALRDNGGGTLITSEFEPSKIIKAKKHLSETNLIDLVEFREGDALKTLSQNLPDRIDFLLLDGAKALYADILKILADHLKPGAFIVADNADYCPEYLEIVRNPLNGFISIPFSDDVELTMKIK